MSHSALKIGIIGLDTSHVTAFTEILHKTDHPYHVPGGRIVTAFPGGSPDFELSRSRVQRFTEVLSGTYGVRIADSIDEVAAKSDAILLESVDGRVHREQFMKIAPYGKPVFIDKPFAVSLTDATTIAAAAEHYQVPLMSCSALRYAEGLTSNLADHGKKSVTGMDCYGPMALEPTQPGLFWYGIHTAEMLFAAMGRGCIQVSVVTNEHHDLIVGEWGDGRIGTLRGNRKGNSQFGAVIQRKSGSSLIDVYSEAKPYYASLLERIMDVFRTGKSPIELEETIEVVRFIEAANLSRSSGRTIKLSG